MPSISVPLKDARGWDALMKQRRDWWAKQNRNKLTANFKATEFYTHDGSPCPTVSRNGMVRLCQDYLEPLRAKFGTANVLSGYRHELYNAKIHGARNSQHIYENTFESVAADMRFQRGTPAQWGAEAKRLRTKCGGKGGIGIYPKSGFLHIDNRGYKADWSQ
jgi:Peptidase M15